MEISENWEDRHWIEEAKGGGWHIVAFAEVGLSHYSAYCEFAYGVDRAEQERFASMVNAHDETGTLYPSANITILPKRFFRQPLEDMGRFRAAIRDAFVAQRDLLKTPHMLLEFTCARLPNARVFSICHDLATGEFSGVQCAVLLRMDRLTDETLRGPGLLAI